MSLYRILLTAIVSLVIALPSYAANDTSTQTTAPMTQGMVQKVNLNTATAKDLMKIKGINARRAKAIVTYRKKHGNFKSIDELNNVKGFKKLKPDTLKGIQDHLEVE